MSALHRITGGAIAALFYGGALAYVFNPVASSVIVASAHAFPASIVFLSKLAVGTPLFYHSFNGVRHLVPVFNE